jgi:energy-coupling factor transporter ATP-binding protein EcfA2
MIHRLEIRNWQSLVNVDLDLGALTAIVGPTSCGKTALMRAVKALASNVRGGGSITSGAKAAAITAHTADHKITWQRGVTDGGRYVLADLHTGREETYTKLAGSVPEPITQALHIAPAPTTGTSLNIASQFEPPFLLRESGANVARLLGTLTNVSRILAAVQEANRRRHALMSTLKVREGDLADKLQRAQHFATLTARLAAREQAERHVDTTERLLNQINRLTALIDIITIADGVLSRAAARPPLPDDTAVHAAAQRLASYTQQVRAWVTANNAVAEAAQRVQAAEQAETDAQHVLDEALAAAGRCPTCGQRVDPFTRAGA